MSLIHEKLAAIQEDVDGIAKDQRHQKGYNFRGVEDFLNAIHPLLVKHQVNIVPQVQSATDSIFTTSNGKQVPAATVLVRYKFVATDGSFEEATVSGYDYNTEGAHHANAQKDAYKVALEQMFSIPTVKQQIAAENNGYAEPLVTEEKKPTTPHVSTLNKDQIRKLEGVAGRTESWDEFWQMVKWVDGTPALAKDAAVGDIAIAVAEKLAKKDQAGFRKAIADCKDWKWYARIMVGGNRASVANLEMLDKSKEFKEKELGACPDKIYTAIKQKFS